MQRKQNKPSLKKGTVSTPGMKSRRAKRKANAQPDTLGLYRTPARVSMTPGSVSLPMRGTGSFRGQKYSIPRGSKISKEGLSFLKCAFAPPDFGEGITVGVPDPFEGTSLVKKHRAIFTSLIPPNTDRYILCLPVPGISHYICDVTANQPLTSASIFIGQNYSDSASLFGAALGANAADVVNRFRFVSNHIEIIPTVNAVQWTGSVQCWKLPVQMVLRQIATTLSSSGYSITGLQGCNASNANQYTGPYNNGVYCGAYSSDSKFEFCNVVENQAAVPYVVGTGDFGQLVNQFTALAMPGLDNAFESICIKISGVGANVSDSYILKTWACVEYQVVTGSSLYEYQTLSSRDDCAMALYKAIIKELPIATTYMDNDTFWERVLQIIRMVSGGLSFLPGPYGQIAGGVNAATNLLM